MAASQNLIYIALILLFFPFSHARSPVLVLPVRKIPGARQYVTRVYRGTPAAEAAAADELVVDLGGSSLWLHCDSGSESSTRRPARCRSAQCSLAGSTRCVTRDGLIRPDCDSSTTGDACLVFPENPVTGVSAAGELVEDVVALRSSADGRVSSFPGFLFACGSATLLRGLAVGANGVAGLGRRSRLTLPSQLSAALGSEYRKFALCLSSSETYSDGFIFFGDGPLMLPSGKDVSKSLTYTPLITRNVNPSTAGDIPRPSDEYFIGLNSIRINQKRIPLNSTLLSISTVTPYTTLETTIYTAVVDEFVNSAESMGIARAAPVAPFSACFSAENVGTSSSGYPVVPTIDLVLQSELVYWRISGASSMMTFAGKGVMCLALMDAGPAPGTSIVVGGHQLEENLLQLDVAASRLGFAKATCSDFGLTSDSPVRYVSSL